MEAALEILFYIYKKIALLIYPDHEVNERAKQKIEKIIAVVFFILLASIFIGVFMMLGATTAPFQILGKCLTFIPLSIIGLQIFIGIIFKIIQHIKK